MNMRVKGLNLEWNVLNYDWNEKKIVNYNVIKQDLIDDIVKKARKKEITKHNELNECIRNWAFYHYRRRCEYEILVGDLCNEPKLEKIDIYRQIEINLDRLTEYIAREMRLFL